MMLLLYVEIYTSFILFLLLSYCESIKTTFTSGIKGVVSLSPSTITTTSLLPSPAITTAISSSSTSSSLSISHEATYFTGAGIYLFWQMGAAKYLQENTCITECSDMPIVGASAGSLTATMLLTGVDFEHAKNVAVRLAKESKVHERGNLVGILGQLLRQWLEEIIPSDINVDRLANLYIALTPLTKSPKLVKDFKDKKDLIDCCMASCHLPVLLDGSVLTNYRGEGVMDGSFWYFITKNRFTGLPLIENCQNYFWVDYGDDSKFMKSITGNIIELVDEAKLDNMMKMGYMYMKREHAKGNLPFPNAPRPTPSIADIVDEEGLSNFLLIKTIGSIALKSNLAFDSGDIQALVNDNNTNMNNNDGNNNDNNSKRPRRRWFGSYPPDEVLDPIAATISSLFSGESSSNIDISDLLMLTSLIDGVQ